MQGFYGVYEGLFAKLASQERKAFDERDDKDGRSAPTFPGFGLSTADAATVSAFYGFWTHFSSYKDFAWADEYNPASAPNR